MLVTEIIFILFIILFIPRGRVEGSEIFGPEKAMGSQGAW